MMAHTVDYRIPAELQTEMSQWRPRAIGVGIAGAVLRAIGFFAAGPNQFYRSYLWSYIFIVAISLGPVAWLMLQYVTGGAWGLVIRRACEAAGRTLPLTLLMFIPIMIGMNNLSPWPNAAIINANPLLNSTVTTLN